MQKKVHYIEVKLMTYIIRYVCSRILTEGNKNPVYFKKSLRIVPKKLTMS